MGTQPENLRVASLTGLQDEHHCRCSPSTALLLHVQHNGTVVSRHAGVTSALTSELFCVGTEFTTWLPGIFKYITNPEKEGPGPQLPVAPYY